MLRTLLLCVLLNAVWLSCFAQNNQKKSIKQLLNKDGSLNLNTGFSGSLDPAGFEISLDENGQPIFKSAKTNAVSSPQWAKGWENAGVGGEVKAVAVNGSDVYIGGSFTTVGSVTVNNIAKWDGSSWSALGSGLSSTVFAMVVQGGELYVGGVFTDAGGNTSADRIAKWNGTSWSALGSGLSSTVRTLVTDGTNIYAGGHFTNAGGDANADYVAKWDGSSWASVGSGLNNSVWALATDGTNLYAGGYFTDAGGDANADRFAKWDGSTWAAVGTDIFNNFVRAIAIDGSDVYVGGSFFSHGGDGNADYIMKWNGSSWSALGTGADNYVSAISISGSDVYIGGAFTSVGGVSNTNKIAKWNGSAWSALGTGLNDDVNTIVVDGSNVYVGGLFTSAGDNSGVDYFANYKSSSWNNITTDNQGLGLSGTVYDMAVDGTNLYVGGSFTNAGGVADADYLAKWDGCSWSAVSSGLNATVRSIAIDGSNIYVGGEFTDAGGVAAADRFAKWDGSNWSAVGSSLLGNYVGTIFIDGSDIYIGGPFTNAGGIAAADYIAKWDGSAWSALGSSAMNNEVNAIVKVNTTIYAGGFFTNAGGDTDADYLAQWNGSAWSAVGSSTLSLFCYDLATDGTNLYVAGKFQNLDGNANADAIAVWNGSSWSNLGSPSTTIYSVWLDGSDVYVGGSFTNFAGISNADYIAKWNGSAWSALGTGTDATVYAVAVIGNNVYAGGTFEFADGHQSKKFGVYNYNSVWTGSAWDNGTPGSTDDAYIEGSYTSTSDLTVNKLTTKNGAALSIAAGHSYTVSACVENNGTISIENTGALVQGASSTLLGEGTHTMKRSASSHNQYYNLWSSPLEAGTASVLLTNQSVDDTYSFSTATNSWTLINNTSQILNPGQGYAATGNVVDGIRTFSGTGSANQFNNGDVTYTLSTAGSAWNLVGNPYPSAISIKTSDADDLFEHNSNINANIYYWADKQDHTRSSTDYAIWDGSAATSKNGYTPDGYIPAGQGFFVEANAATNLTFKNVMRVAGNNSNFSKTTDTDEIQRIWLNATSSLGSEDQIMLKFMEDATDEYDSYWEARELKFNTYLSFYSVLGDDDLIIQAMSSIDDYKVIPLGIDIGETDDYTIAYDKDWNLEEYDILLEDKALNKIIDLRDEAYTFSATEGEVLRDRFLLHVSHKITGLDESFIDGGIGIFSYEKTVYVDFQELGLGNQAYASVFDISGRVVLANLPLTIDTERKRIDLKHLKAGIYIIQVYTENIKASQKVLIK